MSLPEQSLFVAGLDPIPPDWLGMGAVRRVPDSRDYPAVWHPEVREVLLAGGADAVDWSNKVCSIENQGMEGSCVPHSTDAGIQINENINQQVCYRFNSPQLYHELGGTGQNGVDSRQTLERCKSVGAPLINSAGRVRVGSYFWIDQNPATFATQVKAALVAGKSVVIALLLPSTFSGKWTVGNPTQGYHQIPAAGTQGDLFWGPNSWGSEWPANAGAHPPGFYELSFQYCVADGMQHNYCYGYFFDTVAFDKPPPPPPKIFVSGYNPNPVASGQSFTIAGTGFDQGGVTMTWQGQALPLLGMNPDVIATRAPQVAVTQSAPVHVVVGSGSTDGPALTVQADNTPPPPVVKGAAVTGRAVGDNVEQVTAHQPYALQSPPGVVVTFDTVTQDSGPTPPPGQLTVTGYSGYTPPLLPGQPFTILGSGFAQGGNLVVTWGTSVVPVTSFSDSQINATAPAGASGSNPITVRVEGQTATGPLLVIGDGGPPPAGDIKVMVTAKPSQLRNTVSVIVYTADKNGGSLPAAVNGTVTGSQGSVELTAQRTNGTQNPAIWSVARPAPWGEPCRVVVQAFAGNQTGTGTTTG